MKENIKIVVEIQTDGDKCSKYCKWLDSWSEIWGHEHCGLFKEYLIELKERKTKDKYIEPNRCKSCIDAMLKVGY